MNNKQFKYYRNSWGISSFLAIVFLLSIFLSYWITKSFLERNNERSEILYNTEKEFERYSKCLDGANNYLLIQFRQKDFWYGRMHSLRTFNHELSMVRNKVDTILSLTDQIIFTSNIDSHNDRKKVISYMDSLQNQILDFNVFILENDIVDTALTVYKEISHLIYSGQLNSELSIFNQNSKETFFLYLSDFKIRFKITANKLYRQLEYHTYHDWFNTEYALINDDGDFIRLNDNFKAQIYYGSLYIAPVVFYQTDVYPYYDSVIESGQIKYRLIDSISYNILPIDLKNGYYVMEISSKNLGLNEFGGLMHFQKGNEEIWIPFVSSYYVK